MTTTSRKCRQCHGQLAASARADAAYCSSGCRVAAHRLRRTIPAAMVAADRWVRYSASKVPLQARGGGAASSTNSETWSSYADSSASSIGAGLGFVLAGDGIVCLDLDDALDADGHAKPWAAALLARLPRTYAEVSPSGRGLHVYGRGYIAKGRNTRRSDGGGLEAYATGRYVTVTGRRFGHWPSKLADLGDLANYF